MLTKFKRLCAIVLCALLIPVIAGQSSALAAEKKSFKLVWSIYVGWMPLVYAEQSGILKKWADKYGIKIELVQLNDYVESLNQYTAGKFDAVALTNMDALTIPSAGGVDTTAAVLVDFSNGNDAVIVKNGSNIADLKGRKVNMVEFSVSHYLLARGLALNGMSEKDLNTVNTSDADIVAAFGTPDVNAVVTWNPQVSEILKAPGATKVFDSSQIPGEIIDVLAVNTDILKANPSFGKALAGAWYEAVAIVTGDTPVSIAARESLAKQSGTDLAGFEGQLKTTRLFKDPKEAAEFLAGQDVVRTMDLVRRFSFEKGLLGEGAKTLDAVGIAFPRGEILGDKKNVKLRFDSSFAALAAEGKL